MFAPTQKVVDRVATWKETEWKAIFARVATVMRLTPEERRAYESHSIAQLIGAIPYFAECENPDEVAEHNLTLYLASCGPATPMFFHRPEHDSSVYARLSAARYDGGDERVILKGMSMLALNMLCDYERDIALDASMGKYNPIGAGVWDFESLHDELVETIDSVESPELESLISRHEVMNAFWSASARPFWF